MYAKGTASPIQSMLNMLQVLAQSVQVAVIDLHLAVL